MKLLVLMSFLSVALAQPPSIPPESFIAQIDVEFSCRACGANYSVKGTGHFGRDIDKKSQVEELELKVTLNDGTTVHVNTFILWRFDLNPPQNFTLNEVDGKREPCEKQITQGDLVKMWEWLKVATNTGNVIINGHNVTMWNYTDATTGTKLATGLEKHDDNPVQPYYFYYYIGGNGTQVIFNDFHHEPPHDQHNFEIPEECEHTSSKAYQLFNGLFQFMN